MAVYQDFGAGSVPIETNEGWLLIYHGVINTCNGFVYRMGLCGCWIWKNPGKCEREQRIIFWDLTNCMNVLEMCPMWYSHVRRSRTQRQEELQSTMAAQTQ